MSVVVRNSHLMAVIVCRWPGRLYFRLPGEELEGVRACVCKTCRRNAINPRDALRPFPPNGATQSPKCEYFSGNRPLSANCIWRAERGGRGCPRLTGGCRDRSHSRVCRSVAGTSVGKSQPIKPQGRAARRRPGQPLARSWQELPPLKTNTRSFRVRLKSPP